MIMNNKQPKTTPAFSSENAFNNNRSIYLRLDSGTLCRRRDLLVLLKAGRRIHGNERFREPTDPADRDEIRLFPRGSDAICRPHRTHEFPGTENRPHDRISGLLRYGPLRTPFFVPDPGSSTPPFRRFCDRLLLRLHGRISPAIRPRPSWKIYGCDD